MLPLLLALGLMGANQYAKAYGERQKEQDIADRYAGLLGNAAGPMGPPTEGGDMGWQGGSGLMGDPGNKDRQMQFAAGVTQIPGQAPRGLQLLEQAFGRQQQGEQWQTGENRLQAGQNFQQEQALAEAARMAQQYGQTFAQTAQQNAEQAKRSADQLEIAREHLRLDQQRTRAALGKVPADNLPKGWYMTDSSTGPTAAPERGTKPWADAMDAAQSLERGIANIGQMRDVMEGAEKLVNGKPVRAGGSGTELFGDKAGTLRAMHGQVVSDIGVLRQLGTMQPGDLKTVGESFKDPTSVGAAFTTGAETSAGYQATQQLFENKLRDHYKANPWMLPAPPKNTVPGKAQKRKPGVSEGF